MYYDIIALAHENTFLYSIIVVHLRNLYARHIEEAVLHFT